MGNEKKPMIEIGGLKKSYGDFEALRGLDFSVPKGQVVGFLGPNGAGKSTTMKILTGYLPYSIGTVKVGGLEVANNSFETRTMIGYLPENNPQYEDMMVAEYLYFIADVRKIPKSEHKNKIERVIERCGIKNVFHKDIGQLSKGYRQRVGLAQAILHEPQLLILDEPTSGLDPNQIIEIRNLITELGRETTVLMSTHILQEAQSTCQRILIINNGLLVADDTPEQLASGNFGSIYLELVPNKQAQIDIERLKEQLRKLKGITKISDEKAEEPEHCALSIRYEDSDPRRQIFETVVDSGASLLEMKRQKASLEETFRRLTTKA
ncbi:MAG: ATP-binding cassette domain-containing protein [Myxococcales bacterium]|nr:ATP-binding cassette domain-containing protein [Myxococcales bacterium]USN50657.1 MAG: ATP-binding cassette domain-containing protein [Myxococcales bacterium]